MAILKVAVLGNPILRIPAEPVKNVQAPEIQRLIDDMLETMQEYRGVGLAAPQVHRSFQIATISADAEDHAAEDRSPSPLVLINPRITPSSDQMEEDWEGCLSLPGLRGKVPRYQEIVVEAVDRRGRQIRRKAAEFHARVIQHECDHLAATLFIDRMKDFQTLTFLDEYARYWAPREDSEDREA
ncbi:MAG TPA: peptide deformylase [Candidatus Acidoferrum sp.]|nr:peptide deformylase [Candidatus Acidoferrum sp.]